MDTKVEMLTGQLAAELDVAELERPVVDPRSLPWRYSTLKQMARSPLHYFHACQSEQDDRLCLRIGAGTHAILFGQPYVKWPDIRRGRAWEAFKEEHADKPILNPKEYVQAQGIADSVRRNADAVKYLLLDTRVEQRIDWTYLGRAFRSTPDAYGKHHVTELKSTRDSSPERFVRDGACRGYPAQIATYETALLERGLSTAADKYIVAVESAPPYPVTVFRVSEETVEQGRRNLRLWAERALVCEASESYPAYAQSVVDFDIGDNDPFSIVVNGEELDV